MAKNIDRKALREYMQTVDETISLYDELIERYKMEIQRKDEIISTYKKIFDAEEQSIKQYEKFVNRLKK